MKTYEINTTDGLGKTVVAEPLMESITDDGVTSSTFAKKNELLYDLQLFNVNVSNNEQLTFSIAGASPEKVIGADRIVLAGWKIIDSISARLIEVQEEVVVLECLIDKENWVYEERGFRRSLFEGYNLELGALFLLRFFDRPHETRMEIHNDPGLTFAEDFPKMNFKKIFSESKLFKEKA